MELLLFPHSLTSVQPSPTTVVVAASNFEQPPPAPSLPFLRTANVANFLPSIAQPPFDRRSIHRAATVPPRQLCSTAPFSGLCSVPSRGPSLKVLLVRLFSGISLFSCLLGSFSSLSLFCSNFRTCSSLSLLNMFQFLPG
ncbi:uncharacterized protein LOC107472920 [Arachis duranensis]|uniref:Uncharacterized protein LOC107472920 n=1 Tax=Arachis duranensis TaxID=130453 RepID=A0A9C6TPF1_ARADU|nr:uncharacterized protein LOC107472920 [Arachis duranensis]